MKFDGKELSEAALREMLNTKQPSVLLDEMEAMLQTEDFDPDIITIYLDILDEKTPIIPDDYDSAESIATFKRMNAEHFEITRRSLTKASKTQRVSHNVRFATRILIAAVFALSVLSMFAFADVFPFMSGFVEWRDEVINIKPTGQLVIDQPGDNGFHSLQEALDAYGVTDNVALKWIPGEFVLAEITVAEVDDGILIVCRYDADEKMLVYRVYSTNDMQSATLEHLQPTVGERDSRYAVGSVVHIISDNLGQPTATWETSSSKCFLNGDVSTSELKKIINSIYKE